MAQNTLLSIGMITKKSMMILENTLAFTKHVNREHDKDFGNKSAQIGDTVSVRKPPQYTVGTTPAFAAQGTVESSVPVTLDKQYNTGISFTSKQLTLDINDFSREVFLEAQIAAIANKIDFDGMAQYKNIYQTVGTAGTTPSSIATVLAAGVKLDNSAVPMDQRRFNVINPAARAGLVGGAVTYFNPQQDIANQYRTGNLGEFGGFGTSVTQNVNTHTVGTFAAAASGVGTAVTVTTPISSGTSVVTGGWTSGDLLKQGDVFTIAGVYAVNPQSRQSTGQLQQFVVAADTTPASGGGAMTITFSPAVVFSGAYQNVTSSTNTVAATSVVTVFATSATSTPQNLAFHRDAFCFATKELDLPMGPNTYAYRVTSKQLNMSLRCIWFYDGFSDNQNMRFDILGGWATLRPELACRIAG